VAEVAAALERSIEGDTWTRALAIATRTGVGSYARDGESIDTAR
jgi:hypothetical protein